MGCPVWYIYIYIYIQLVLTITIIRELSTIAKFYKQVVGHATKYQSFQFIFALVDGSLTQTAVLQGKCLLDLAEQCWTIGISTNPVWWCW